MRIVFIGCVKSKEDHRCEAQDMYISPLFEKSFAYAQQLQPDRIYILSAKYHLLPIDKVISPYDLTLKDMDADERREWGVCISMMEKEGISPNDEAIFLCGELYIENIRDWFSNPIEPLKGLPLGESLHWLDENTEEQYKTKFNLITMSLINRLKLAKMILKFGSIQTDNGELQYEGELEAGLDVFVESEGELIPAPDGEYKSDNKTIIVEGGKIKEIIEAEEPVEEPIEGAEEPVEEPSDDSDELDALKKENEELKARIAELEAQLDEANKSLEDAETKLKMSVEKPAHIEIKESKITNKENKALKYFAQ